MPRFLEIGELVAILLAPVAWLFMWLPCNCEARRTALNIAGEALWRWWDDEGYLSARLRFARVVGFWLRERLIVEPELRELAKRGGVRLSRHSFRRWMERLPVRWIVKDRERWYGLPADS